MGGALVRTNVRCSIVFLVLAACAHPVVHPTFVAGRCPAAVPEPASALSPFVGYPIQAIDLEAVPEAARAAFQKNLYWTRVGELFELGHLASDLADLDTLRLPGAFTVTGREVQDGIALRFELTPWPIVRGITWVGDHGPELGELATLTGAFDDPMRLERLRRHALERWQHQGYRDAAIEIVPTRDAGGDTLCIASTRGPRYTIDQIEVAGSTVIAHDEVIRRLARRDRSINAVGGVYDPALMADALDELAIDYADLGYPIALPLSVVAVARAHGHESLRLTISTEHRFTYGEISIPWPEMQARAGALGVVKGQPYSRLALDRLLEDFRIWSDARKLEVTYSYTRHDATMALTFTGGGNAP